MRRKTPSPAGKLWLLAILVSCLGFAAPGQSYSTINLGTPEGFTNGAGANSVAHAISRYGAVAGEWGPDSSAERAFLWTDITNTDLGMLAGEQYEAAYSVNASNLVVGAAENFFGAFFAYVYTNGTLVDLSVLGPQGYTYSIAHAINDQNWIVGESYTSSALNAQIHAVIFLGNGVTDLGTLPGGNYSAAYGINNSNVIAGESTVTGGNTYAFVYSNNVMTSLGTLPGGNYSAAFAINDYGQIAGEASTSSGEVHAVLCQNGSMTDLGTFGGTNSSARAINKSGAVVGYALTATEESHAFLYEGGTLIDLNPLISATECTNLISADGINDAGQIAGTGYAPNGDKRAFLLTPVLKLTSPAMLAGPHFQFTVQGLPGQKFILQGSTNLAGWIPLNTNTLVATTTNWMDTNAAATPCRFYRAEAVP